MMAGRSGWSGYDLTAAVDVADSGSRVLGGVTILAGGHRQGTKRGAHGRGEQESIGLK